MQNYKELIKTSAYIIHEVQTKDEALELSKTFIKNSN
jgi:hypothetical protein